jgi:hypothetical protein
MEKMLQLKEPLLTLRKNFERSEILSLSNELIMKKCILIISALFFLFSPFFAYAVTGVTPDEENEDIKNKTEEVRDQLITNIASRVAQLKLVEKRGIVGTVNEASNTQITITDFKGNIRFVDVDELTKFSNPSVRGTFGISDIKKGDTIGVLGLYNKESRRILARFVNVIVSPVVIHGGVAAVDSEDYTLSITTEDKKQIIIDVESLTRTFSYTKEEGLIRSGFSKIKENYNIIAIGIPDKGDKNRITATRITFFPEIPISPKANSASENTQKTK